MLGHRGCRLGLIYPEVTRMQVRAIFEAACEVAGEGQQVQPEIMVPLVSEAAELKNQAELIHEVARQVTGEHGMSVDRKSVVEGKSVDLGGRRILKKKRKREA